jgi:hypothetical protein
MARLRRTNNVTVFTFEEKTRLTNVFMLLVEINVRLPKSTKTKSKKCTTKTKNRPIKKESCYIKCPAMCSPLRTALRDLFLIRFTRIFKGSKINPMGYEIDRHHCFVAYT